MLASLLRIILLTATLKILERGLDKGPIIVFPDFHVHVLPSQHFSGRLLEQNATQWASFAIVTSEHKVY